MKQNTKAKTGGCQAAKILTLKELKVQQVEIIPAEKTNGRAGLMVSVFIPEPHVGLFRGYAMLHGMSTRKFARHALFRYLAGEDCQESLDKAINAFLHSLPEC